MQCVRHLAPPANHQPHPPGEIREWDLKTRNVRVPTWTAFLADVHDITAVLGEREVIFSFGHIQTRPHNEYTEDGEGGDKHGERESGRAHVEHRRPTRAAERTTQLAELHRARALQQRGGRVERRTGKNHLNFAPHELNTTLLKRHSSGWGTDFTATDVSLQTMFEFGKGHSHASVDKKNKSSSDRVRFNAQEIMDNTPHPVNSHDSKITAMCYAPLCFRSGLITHLSELDTTSPEYAKNNEVNNYDRYKYLFTSSMDGTVKCWGVEEKRCIGTFSTGVAAPPLYSILLHPVTGQVFAGADDGKVYVWNSFVKCDDRGEPLRVAARDRVLSAAGGGVPRVKSDAR